MFQSLIVSYRQSPSQRPVHYIIDEKCQKERKTDIYPVDQ